MFTLFLTTAFGQRSLTVVPIKRALVIGNSRYAKKPLVNPVNDATDIAAAFRGLGFEVELLLDTNLESLDAAITQFASRLQAGDVALFYYSGHGMEVRGENYLLPVNFDAQFESQVKFKAYSANQVLGLMQERGVRVSMMILDACRDNPYRSWRSSGASGGLAGMNGEGAFIAFATAPGHVASRTASTSSPAPRSPGSGPFTITCGSLAGRPKNARNWLTSETLMLLRAMTPMVVPAPVIVPEFML